MRRTNFRLPLSDVRYDFSSVGSTVFDTIVIGGGVSGSMIAGKLLGEREKLLVIERGDNILRPSKYADWVYHMPANVVANRALNKHFVHRRSQQVDKSALDAVLADAKTSGFAVAHHAKAANDATTTTTTTTTCPIDIQSPNVLGGAHCVLGGRSWFRGIESDWDRAAAIANNAGKKSTMPFDFDPRVAQLLRRLETIPPPELNRMKYFSAWSEAQPTLRGKRGTFTLSRPAQFSGIFKPVLEGMVNVGCDLTTQWDPDLLPKTIGAGRINTIMVDCLTSLGHSTLSSYLAPHLEVQNSVLHECEVESLITSSNNNNSGNSVSGVRVRNLETGATQEIQAKKIVLAAGANESPRLLATAAIDSGKLGSMWTTPTVVLRYKLNQPISLAPAANPVVRALVVEEWRRFGTGWGCSAFDDMSCFYNAAQDIARGRFRAALKPKSTTSAATSAATRESAAATSSGDTVSADEPKLSPYSPQLQDSSSNYGITVGDPVWLRINTQPFMMSSDGEFSAEHGFQVRVSLCRPFSRGGLSSGGENGTGRVVDFKPLSDPRDVEALKTGVDFAVKAIFNGFPPDKGLVATPVDAELVLDGPHGGGCLANEVVDEKTFAVKGLENVFVSDSSVHPHGQCADSHLFVMCATEALHENALGRKLGSLD